MVLEKAFEGFVASIFSGLTSELGKWVSSFDPLRFSKKYKHILTQRHANIKIFGMAKPTNLSNIYIEAIAYEDIPSRVFMNIRELENFLKTSDRTYHQLRRNSALSFIKDSNRILILGKPGSGKTTLLKNLIAKILSNNPPLKLFPLYLSLKEYSDQPDTGIIDFLAHDFDKYCEFPREFAQPFIERILQKGYSIVLLDGLDEVEIAKRKAVIREIEKFSAQYYESKIVISCRSADYLHWFRDFSEIELADFTPIQATEFIRRWFIKAPKRGKLLLAAYNNSSHLQELCSVPIMAALMCILFEYNLKLPENRAELYSECVDSLLYKWDASRLITRQSNYTILSTQKKKTLFANVGYGLMEEQKVVFEQNDLVEHLEASIKSLGIEDGEALLKEIASHHGLFVERSAGY